MATVSRLLYSQQTCIISCGGYLKNTAASGATPDYSWQINDDLVHNTTKNILGTAKHAHSGTPVDGVNTTGGGFLETRNWLLPVQSFSADETIPAEDVLVMGNKAGVHRSQTSVATGKCTVKSYLAEYMSFLDGTTTRDAGILQWYQHTVSTTDANTATEDWVGTMAKDSYLDAEDATAGSKANYADIDKTGDTPSTPDTNTDDGSELQQFVAAQEGPFPGITQKGYLAGEAWIQNGAANIVSQGMLEQLIWEAMGGFESLVQLFNPTTDTGINKMDGVSFIGILSSIGIDASKGGYPTLDLSFESVGQLPFLHMGATNHDGTELSTSVAHADNWYVKSCSPHTSQDVLVWGRDQWSGTATGFANDHLVLLASNEQNFWSEDKVVKQANTGTWSQPTLNQGSGKFGDDANRYGDDGPDGGALDDASFSQGDTDIMNSAKLSFDLPTETLSALGNEVEGNTYAVRHGNRVFSKPPYKASMSLDGQGMKAAGLESVHSSGKYITSRVLPNEIQIGQLHCVVNPAGAGTTARSFSQNVGDIGATYSVTVEGTGASFYGTYQGLTAATVNGDRDVA